MKVVVDIEANGLENPTEIWLIVCKDIDTGKRRIWRNVTQDKDQKEDFLSYAQSITRWIGHNFLEYDYPVLHSLLGLVVDNIAYCCIDTLIVSRLIDYPRPSHSVEDYGLEFGLPKGNFSDFSKYSQAMEDYCVRDVEITHKIYLKYMSYIDDHSWHPSIHLEQRFQLIVNDLQDNGFAFDKPRAETLLRKVTEELSVIDKEIHNAFPERLHPIREINPKITKHGTLSRTDFRFEKSGDLSIYNGGPFTRCEWVPFNPSSHKQLIEVLTLAGWQPINKTKTHIDLEREINHIKYRDHLDNRLQDLYVKLEHLKKVGWKVDEDNLSTLPPSAPTPARLLAKRILLEARRRTLTEQINLVREDGRVHGRFQGLGAWTHRMAHRNPNMANIPREFKEDGSVKLLGKELRKLWIAPKKRLLVGVDAEGIQLRVLAHYLDDAEFTRALVEGKKYDKSDPHSLNQRILGPVCKTRQAAKRFIYALLLGAGISKLAQVLEASKNETQDALQRLISRYEGWKYLKEHVLPRDGERGWFIGIDGRHVRIPGETASSRTHLAMSGYLQNGEAIVMKQASIITVEKLRDEDLDAECMLINIVHDEIQLETPNDMKIALQVAKITADAIREAGEFFKLKCPMAGSYYNEDIKDYTIGQTWYATH